MGNLGECGCDRGGHSRRAKRVRSRRGGGGGGRGWPGCGRYRGGGGPVLRRSRRGRRRRWLPAPPRVSPSRRSVRAVLWRRARRRRGRSSDIVRSLLEASKRAFPHLPFAKTLMWLVDPPQVSGTWRARRGGRRRTPRVEDRSWDGAVG